MYRLSNALPRALLVLAGVLTLGALMGSSAKADGPAPRAIPVARSFVRAFSSYDAVVQYATSIAKDQNALDSRLATVRADSAATILALEEIMPHATRGGRLFEPDAMLDARAVVAAMRGDVTSGERTGAELLRAGALTTDATPWRMPTAGRLTQRFGPTALRVEPGATYGGVFYSHFHGGVDIAGAWAAAVVAPARGRVVFVGRMADGAQIVVLAHDGGVVSLYAHLDALSPAPTVKAGDEVAAGQRIGTVGNTGISTGTHLHWAAWRNGEIVDPLTLIGR